MRGIAPVGFVLLLTAAVVALGDDVDLIGGDRLVHEFDFDERDEGNLEPLPKFWVRFAADDFPRFTEGAFDFEVGHPAAPSLRLRSDGRNVAFRYVGDALPVEPGSEYVVTGFARGANLEHARAAVSAYYLDRKNLPIRSTQRFTSLMGGDKDDTEWHAFRVTPPSAPETATSIGITVWVVQSSVWDTSPKPERHIERNDLGADAWFDDIRVYRLPNVAIRTSAVGNVLRVGEAETLSVSVTDAVAGSVSASLEVVGGDGEQVLGREIPVGVGEEPVVVGVDLSGLAAGMYTARVAVRTGGRALAERSLVFCVLRRGADERGDAVPSFGVVLETEDRADPQTELALLRAAGVGAIKIPVWSGSAEVADLTDGPAGTDRLLYELLQGRVAIIGVLAGSPSEVVRRAGAYPRPLLEYLSEPADLWRDDLSRVIARYTTICRSWQVGSDDRPEIVEDPRLEPVLRNLRREIESLTTAPHLTVPGSIGWAPGDPEGIADELCLTVEPTVLPRFIASHFEDYLERGHPVTSAYVPTPVDARDAATLRDWCKRLAFARHAGIHTLFVSQPWSTRIASRGPVTEPTAALPVLHTLVTVIGRAAPGDNVYIAPTVTALAFHDGDRTTLVMWDVEAGDGERSYDLQLGDGVRRIDMRGRSSTPASTDDGRSRVVLSRDPVFLEGIERWLVEFRTSLHLVPDKVEFAIDTHRHVLQVTNPHRLTVAGSVQLTPPDGWDIRPRRIDFTLAPGGTMEEPLEIRFHRSETAGDKLIVARVRLTADREYVLDVPIELHLGSSDIDAWGQAIVEGNRIIVRHRVINRSDQTLSFRSTAVAPGRPRRSRAITALGPGRSASVEYQFGDAASLIGRPMRLLLRELDGPRIHNIEVYVR